MSRHVESFVFAGLTYLIITPAIATSSLTGSTKLIASLPSNVDHSSNVSGKRCLLQSKLAEGDRVSFAVEDSISPSEGVPVDSLMHSTQPGPPSLLAQPSGKGKGKGKVLYDHLYDLQLNLTNCLEENEKMTDAIEAEISTAEAANKNAGSQVADLKYQIRVAMNATNTCKRDEAEASSKLATIKTNLASCKSGRRQDLSELDLLQKQLHDASQKAMAGEQQVRSLQQELQEEKAGIETTQAKLNTAEEKYEGAKQELEDATAQMKIWKHRALTTLSRLDAGSNPSWENSLES